MTTPALVMFRGETTSYELAATPASGTPQPLTDLTLEAQIKLTAGAADPALISLTVGGGITLLDQGDYPGEFTVTFTAAQTDSLDAGIVWLDVWAASGSSRKLLVRPRRVIVRHVVNPL